MYGKYLQQKRTQKAAERQERAKKVEGADPADVTANIKPIPKTIDSTREVEPTLVDPTDAEVHADENDDEFAPYLAGTANPKVLITTRPRPSQSLFYFIADLQKLIPGLHFHPRKSFTVKEICQLARGKNFTHLIVLGEKAKKCNGMMVSHLRSHDETGAPGPTAYFKLTSVVTSTDIPNHGASTSHIPELHLHGFHTRLGRRVGRLFASLFPHNPQHEGRQVVTFHNQRDFVFVRHHRYIFKEKDDKQLQRERQNQQRAASDADPNSLPGVKTRLQELGPRFTLKLRWLQEGTFDTFFGEYEWYHKRKEMDITRRKFHL
jgi:ribosome production factor 1